MQKTYMNVLKLRIFLHMNNVPIEIYVGTHRVGALGINNMMMMMMTKKHAEKEDTGKRVFNVLSVRYNKNKFVQMINDLCV